LWFLFFDLIYAVEILDGIKRFDSFWARKKRDFVKNLHGREGQVLAMERGWTDNCSVSFFSKNCWFKCYKF